MTNTTYYNLNIVEGTDIVNPLIVDNPNYEKIDEVMHENAVSGVTLATEIANATVHAITRENSECAVIRFIATSNWKAGDTVTVDGVPVTALLPSGETLPDGAYVINANVLCVLTGTNLTIYAERKNKENANEIAYNDTNVAAELDKLNSNLTTKTESQVTSAYGTITITIKNGICTLSGNLSGLPVGIWTTLVAGLPTPHAKIIVPAFTTDTTNLVAVGVLKQGDLIFYSPDYNSVSVSLSYQIND